MKDWAWAWLSADEETINLTADTMGPVVQSEPEFEARKLSGSGRHAIVLGFWELSKLLFSMADTWEEGEVTCTVNQEAHDNIFRSKEGRYWELEATIFIRME